MTTIAYRDGVMAVDSRGSCSGWKVDDASQKIVRGKDGTIYAWSGDFAGAWPLVQKLLQGEAIEKTPAGTRIVVLPPKGDLTVYEEAGWFPHPRDLMCAWGSGFPPALAALYMGASPKRAVEIAAMIDTDTGGPVVVMKSRG